MSGDTAATTGLPDFGPVSGLAWGAVVRLGFPWRRRNAAAGSVANLRSGLSLHSQRQDFSRPGTCIYGGLVSRTLTSFAADAGDPARPLGI